MGVAGLEAGAARGVKQHPCMKQVNKEARCKSNNLALVSSTLFILLANHSNCLNLFEWSGNSWFTQIEKSLCTGSDITRWILLASRSWAELSEDEEKGGWGLFSISKKMFACQTTLADM